MVRNQPLNISPDFKDAFKIRQNFHDTNTVYQNLHIDVLPPLVVVFVQFKICIWFPRHMYNDMVLLSSRVRGHRTVNAILVETRTICLKWWKPGQYAQNGGNQDNTVRFKY